MTGNKNIMNFLVELIEFYSFFHKEEEKEQLIRDILDGNVSEILSTRELEIFDPDQLKKGVIQLISKYDRFEPYRHLIDHELIQLEEQPEQEVATEMESPKKEQEPEQKITTEMKSPKKDRKPKKFTVKRVAMIGLITSICLSTITHGSNKKASSTPTKNKVEIYQDLDFYKEDSIEQIVMEKPDLRNLEEERRKKVLNNFSKCKTIEDILKRGEQLESLNLTKKDKIYKDCKLSAALQRFTYELSVLFGYPIDFTFSVIHAETRGGFNSSGTASYNPRSDTYDYGLTQQNSEYSARDFAEKFNISYKRACKLLQYNDYVNLYSAFLEYNKIKAYNPNAFDPYDYAGWYNGWSNWKKITTSQQYVKIFRNAYDNIYTEHHNIEKRKNENKEKVKVWKK